MNNTTDPIDWDDILRINNNNKQLAEEMVNMFILELPSLQKTINDAHQNNKQKLLVDTSHRLQGSCSYCGAHKLKKIAAQLEEAANAKQDQNVKALIPQLNDEIQHILTVMNHSS